MPKNDSSRRLSQRSPRLGGCIFPVTCMHAGRCDGGSPKISPPRAVASDNKYVSVFACCQNTFATLSRAAAKAASARLRRLAVLPVRRDWAARAAVCERCHVRYVQRGVSYCGKPLLQDIDRDPATDGCGCPTHDKAKSPEEHCPLDARNQPAQSGAAGCNCKVVSRGVSGRAQELSHRGLSSSTG